MQLLFWLLFSGEGGRMVFLWGPWPVLRRRGWSVAAAEGYLIIMSFVGMVAGCFGGFAVFVLLLLIFLVA
jgi:hypothetical protein